MLQFFHIKIILNLVLLFSLFLFFQKPVFAGNSCAYLSLNRYVCAAWDQCGTGASCADTCSTGTTGTVKCGGGSCTYQCNGTENNCLSGDRYIDFVKPGETKNWESWNGDLGINTTSRIPVSYTSPQGKLTFVVSAHRSVGISGGGLGGIKVTNITTGRIYTQTTGIRRLPCSSIFNASNRYDLGDLSGNGACRRYEGWVGCYYGMENDYASSSDEDRENVCGYIAQSGPPWLDEINNFQIDESDLASGVNQFDVSILGEDSVGSCQTQTFSYTYVPDTAPPTCTDPTYTPSNKINGTSITGTGTASDANGIARTGIYVYQGNNYIQTVQDNSTINTSTSLSRSWNLQKATSIGGGNASDGTYQMHFNWYDPAGNMKQCKADFTIDKIPPTCTSPTFSPGASVNGTITGTSTASDANGIARTGIYVYQGNNYIQTVQDNSTINTSTNLSRSWNLQKATSIGGGNASDGIYQMHFNWYDSAGNMKQCKADFTIDKTPPTSTFTAGPTQVCLNSTQTYSIRANDNTALDIFYYTYSPTSGADWMKTPFPLYSTSLTGKVANGSASVTFSSANGFAKGSSYYFASGAYDDAGNKCSGNQFINSWPSGGWYYCGNGARKTVSVVASPNAPTLNTVSTGVLNKINLAWTDNSNDESNFTIYRNGSFLTTLGANATSYTDTSVSCGVNHSYQVFANNVYTCGGNGSSVKTGSCRSDNPTVCGTWTFNPVSPSATNNLSVTARASDSDGFNYANIKGYRGGGSFNYIYNQSSSASTISGTWNTSALVTAVYQLDANWTDNNGFVKTCSTSYGIDRTAPSQPGAITANATCGGVSGISWGASTDSGAVVSGFDHYEFNIDEDNNNSSNFASVCGSIGNTGDRCFNTTSTSYNLYNFKKGKTYKIWVIAVDKVGNKSSAVTKTLTISSDPAKPVISTASVSGDRKITLTWSALGFVASNYAVVSTDTYGAITCNSSTCTAVSNIVSCGNHSYAVRVTNSCGYSATSNTGTVTAGAFVAKPVVTATKSSDPTKITLSWPKDANATSYTVNGSGTKSTPSCSGSTCTSVVTGLSCSTTYTYSVTANNVCGSNTSNNISVKPNCAPTCAITGGTSTPYNVGVVVPLGSTKVDEGNVSYGWSATAGSVPNSSTASTVNYTTTLANGAAPRVDLKVTDSYGAYSTCSKIISTIAGVVGTHSLASGSINRALTDNVTLTYSITGYKNQNSAGNSINATATINTSGTSMCNSVANCDFVNNSGVSLGKSVPVSQGDSTLKIKVTLKNPGNLRSGAYTFPVNFVSSVGNITPVATVTVSNRLPTCTITGINSATLYNRNQVIPITLNYSDADGDAITAKAVSASTSCGSVSALTSANKADYTTPNVNGVSCVVTASVTDSQSGVGTCTAIAKVKASDIAVAFNPVPNQNRNPAPVVITMPFTTTMENDQDGTASVNTSTQISVNSESLVNLCKSGVGTCVINNSTVTNGTNSKTLTVTLQASVLKTLNPSTNYGAGVNITAPSSVRNPSTGVVTTTTLNGSGGVKVLFLNSNPTCNAVSFTTTSNTALSPLYSNIDSNRFSLASDVRINANVTDADGDSVTVTWTAPSGNGTFSNISGSSIDYKTDNEFNKTDSYSYIATDGKGGTCSPYSSLIGTEAATIVTGKIFEVQSSDCSVLPADISSLPAVANVILTDRTYNSAPVIISKTTDSNGLIDNLPLKNSATTESGNGNAAFNVSGLPMELEFLSGTCVTGGATVARSGNQFTLSGVQRGQTKTVNIPVLFSPNPYVASEQGDIFSGAVTSPVLKRPVLTNSEKLISKTGAPAQSYGLLLSQAVNHNSIFWDNGKVDFTTQKGIFKNETITDGSITRKNKIIFDRPDNGIFAVIEKLSAEGELQDGIVYETDAVTIDDDASYNTYKGKILVVNGDVELNSSYLLTVPQPVQLFILTTDKITVTDTTSTNTLTIKGALISGITADSGGILDLTYGIDATSSTDLSYKNASIKMIFDPSIYLNEEIGGVKVLEYKIREIK